MTLSPQQKTVALAAIVGKAHANIGQRETGYSNWGPFAEKVLAFVGIDVPAAWCMAFAVFVVYAEATYNLLIKTGSVQQQVDHAKARGTCIAAADVLAGKAVLRAGYLMCEFGTGGGWAHYEHTGVVTAVARDGSFISCEGNTNNDGGREGYAVMEHHRHIADTIPLSDGTAHAKYCFLMTV